MKLVKKLVVYKDKITGDSKQCFNFYVETETGYRIAVKCVYKDDYKVLKAVADCE